MAPLVLIRAVQWNPARAANAIELRKTTGGKIVWDQHRDPTATFIDALRTAAREAEWHGRGSIHMEDDALLTSDWRDKTADCLAANPDQVVQWFSMRKSDLDKGSRREPGRSFASLLCCYVPPRLAADMALAITERPLRHGDPRTLFHAFDYAVADFLASRREFYHLHVPSLANHHQGWRSAVDPRRSRFRHSPSFQP